MSFPSVSGHQRHDIAAQKRHHNAHKDKHRLRNVNTLLRRPAPPRHRRMSATARYTAQCRPPSCRGTQKMLSCGACRTAAQSRKQNTPRSKTAPVRTAPCGSSSYGSQGIPPESYRCPPPCSAPSAQGRSACPSRQDSSHTNCSPASKAKRHTAIKSPQCRKGTACAVSDQTAAI